MKLGIPLYLTLGAALCLAGCGANPGEASEPQDESAAVEPAEDHARDEEPEPEDDENAPEYLVPACLDDATPVTFYASHTVDSTDSLYECVTLKLPSSLEMDEVSTIESGTDSDFIDDDTAVKEYFSKSDDHAVFLIADGAIKGTRAATDHQLTASCTVKTEPVTREGLQTDFPKATITDVTIGGVDGFIVMPDPAANDTGFVDASVFLNVGSLDDGYSMKHFTATIAYSGGMMNYTDVDFDQIKEAMLNMIEVNFRKVG